MAKLFMELVLFAGGVGFAIRATLILRTGVYTTKWRAEPQNNDYKAYAVANYAFSAVFFSMFVYGLFSH